MLQASSSSQMLTRRTPCSLAGNIALAAYSRRMRSGFTLVELMVVILIIGLLAAATTTVVVKVIESQRKGSSKLLVDTIDNALSTQTSKLVDSSRKLASGETSGESDALAETYVAQNWSSVFVNSVSGAATIPSYLAQMKGLGLTSPFSLAGLELPNGTIVGGTGRNDPTVAEFESSFCLYMVLRGRFSALDAETLGRNGVQYAGPNKIPYIVDQWGDPITFTIGQPEKKSTGTQALVVPKAFCKNL